MAKARIVYVCTECGAEFPKWQGQCEACNAWNTLSQVRLGAPRAARPVRERSGYAGTGPGAAIALSAVRGATENRHTTGIAEFDRVLGGGLVDGSVVLIGGDPGIGKSTLLLQALANFAGRRSCLYVTGEESLTQVAARAGRLGLAIDGLMALAETCVERILDNAATMNPQVLVIDSIQTIWSELLPAAPGSVSQVRESAARLTRYAKEQGASVLLVGHVTKEGGIAGPRVLEHIVDAVLYFEGDVGSRFRVLRAFKNRYGAVNELGVFAMGDRGLREVANPSAIFLSGQESPNPGSCITVTREGTRPLLVEVQALVDPSPLSNPRRVALGVEQNRLAMLLAVLHRHGGIGVYDQDVFINVVGGIRLQETSADLALVLAVLSSFRDKALSRKLAVFGEVGLSGEIRPVPNGEERLKEALTHGFERVMVPRANAPRRALPGIEVVAVQSLREALEGV